MIDEDGSPLDRRVTQNWHLEKTVSISHIFTTIAAISAIFILGSKFDTRLALSEQAFVTQHSIDARQDSDALASREIVRQQLRDINAKLDRLIERK